MNAGELSSVQLPRSRSIGARWNGLKVAARDTRRQKSSSAARAASRPPFAMPWAKTAAFIAPAEVPEIASTSSQGSSSSRSSTPQVKAPCDPPPCSARSTSTVGRVRGAVPSCGRALTGPLRTAAALQAIQADGDALHDRPEADLGDARGIELSHDPVPREWRRITAIPRVRSARGCVRAAASRTVSRGGGRC